MKKKIGAFGAGQFSLGTLVGDRPGTTIFQNPGGGGAGGGVAYKDPAWPPPRGRNQTSRSLKEQHFRTGDTQGTNKRARGTLRKIAEDCEKLRNFEKLPTSPPPPSEFGGGVG